MPPEPFRAPAVEMLPSGAAAGPRRWRAQHRPASQSGSPLVGSVAAQSPGPGVVAEDRVQDADQASGILLVAHGKHQLQTALDR